MDHCLADAEITGRNAFIEGRQSTLGIHPLDALPYRHLHFGIVVQLHSRLHKPNGIRGRGWDKTSASSAHYVNQRRIPLNKATRRDQEEGCEKS